MATHSSILVWRIPRTEEPGRLQTMGLQIAGHNWVTEYPQHKVRKKIKSYSPQAWTIPNTLLSMCIFWLIYSFQQLSEFDTIIILIYFTDKETEDQPTCKKKKKKAVQVSRVAKQKSWGLTQVWQLPVSGPTMTTPLFCIPWWKRTHLPMQEM